MPPKRLGNEFKTIKIDCKNGHEIARYRKPKSESGHRTHKIWLVIDRINRLETRPPILVTDPETQEDMLAIPPTNTLVECGAEGCGLEIGTIQMVLGTIAIKLNESNLKPTKG